MTSLFSGNLWAFHNEVRRVTYLPIFLSTSDFSFASFFSFLVNVMVVGLLDLAVFRLFNLFCIRRDYICISWAYRLLRRIVRSCFSIVSKTATVFGSQVNSFASLSVTLSSVSCCGLSRDNHHPHLPSLGKIDSQLCCVPEVHRFSMCSQALSAHVDVVGSSSTKLWFHFCHLIWDVSTGSYAPAEVPKCLHLLYHEGETEWTGDERYVIGKRRPVCVCQFLIEL